MTALDIVLLALFGGLGASARYLVGTVVPTSFPVGTWVVNILGSVALGLISALAMNGVVPANWLAILGIGFCGGFTTFSTASVDTVELWIRQERLYSIANAALMALVCVAAAGGGWAIGVSL